MVSFTFASEVHSLCNPNIPWIAQKSQQVHWQQWISLAFLYAKGQSFDIDLCSTTPGKVDQWGFTSEQGWGLVKQDSDLSHENACFHDSYWTRQMSVTQV